MFKTLDEISKAIKKAAQGSFFVRENVRRMEISSLGQVLAFSEKAKGEDVYKQKIETWQMFVRHMLKEVSYLKSRSSKKKTGFSKTNEDYFLSLLEDKLFEELIPRKHTKIVGMDENYAYGIRPRILIPGKYIVFSPSYFSLKHPEWMYLGLGYYYDYVDAMTMLVSCFLDINYIDMEAAKIAKEKIGQIKFKVLEATKRKKELYKQIVNYSEQRKYVYNRARQLRFEATTLSFGGKQVDIFFYNNVGYFKENEMRYVVSRSGVMLIRDVKSVSIARTLCYKLNQIYDWSKSAEEIQKDPNFFFLKDYIGKLMEDPFYIG